MDKLHLMMVYVAVAEEEGFSAGARRLKMSPPAVTRAISALENNLGVKLLNRTTRYVKCTEAGVCYLNDAKKILHEVQTADDAAAGINATPKGHLAITAPVMFGRMYVMPCIVDYLSSYIEAKVEAVFLDRVVNLLEEGIDVGIRIGELPDSSMRALKVGSVRLVLCASQNYLNKNHCPKTPEELLNHSIISSHGVTSSPTWQFEHKNKQQLVKLQPRLTVTSNDAAIEAALNDFGITRLLSYQVAPYLASGELKIVLENYEPKPKPIHIVHRENHLTTAKVRAFIDLISIRLRADKTLN